MAHYLDTSALVKLVLVEPESEALREWLLDGGREPVTSAPHVVAGILRDRQCARGTIGV